MSKISVLCLLICGLIAINVDGINGKTGFGPGQQEWGYQDVRPGVHMFWWLYYTTARDISHYTERPLVIWLQGGPGASSTGYGNFEELGPLDLYLNPRNFTWVKDMNVLFIDNPVGTGFSYVDDLADLTTNNTQIAIDLVSLMRGFYVLYPEFKTVDLHIFSESYGGKMAAEFALILDQEIKANRIDCPLKSVALIDSWISPIDSVLSWAPFLLNIGAVDQDGYTAIHNSAIQTRDALNSGNFVEATNLWGRTENVILRETRGIDFYNVLLQQQASNTEARLRLFDLDFKKAMFENTVNFDEDRDDMLDHIMNYHVHKALNLTSKVTWGNQRDAVFNALYADFMKPVVHVVERLLNETTIDVMCITGQLDLIVATAGTVNWVDNMQWNGKAGYLAAPRNALGVNGVLEGYLKQSGKFHMYWINRSGHMVPADNPSAMGDILKTFVGYE